MLRRTKDEVLDLPPKLRTWLPVTVPDGTATKEIAAAGALERLGSPRTQGRPRTRRAGRTHAAHSLTSLKRARQQIAVAKVDTTIEFVDGVVAQGEKVIVFTASTSR